VLTIKDYAKQRNKSVQAVYKQIKAKENALLLDGHILIKKIGNKNTKVLDDVAVAVLDEASRQAPIIVEQTNKDEELEQLRAENKILTVKVLELQEILTVKVLELQEKLIVKSERIEELQQLRLEDNKKQQEQAEKESVKTKGGLVNRFISKLKRMESQNE